jgi:DHA2 family multidrug resistance protein
MQYVLEEGEKNDWFQDHLILALAILSGICLVSLVWWQLSRRNKAPVIDFRVLNNRTLSATIFLFVVLGFGIYGGTYLFPLFAQTVLGFTSMQTGLALLPGGIATGCSILICGAILNKPKPIVDIRWIIVSGTLVTMVSMWQLGHLSTESGTTDTMIALLLRGLGTGLLFVPINQAAFASLQKHELQQGSGLLSLSRQLGGSFGIALIATFVQNHIQYHRADLLVNYSVSNNAFTDRLHGLVGMLSTHGVNGADGQTAALGLLNFTLMRQAMTMAYNDAFMLMLLVNLITLPAVLLLRKPKGAVHAEAVME